ncbi:MAG: hypothetical protein NTU73_13725 [Ignavibacteriae bacterium]|nr:hypothetical protein [Ignavibacteriota bacterium]
MKYINFLFIPLLFLLFSCGQQFKEITPITNENNIKIKLEIVVEKPAPGSKAAFTLKLINTGERDLARCSLKFDNKYEHQLEGLINKSEDWEGKIKYSMLKVEESVTIPFNNEFDNYSIFGIPESEACIPETIELNCLDGKVIWKTK